jgi:RNA polymerase sigma-70 factor (ECF subfamily)
MNLDQLVQRCRQGDLAAFSELFNLYQVRVYRLAVAILRDEHDAEDAMQDVFIRVFKGIEDYRGEASFTAWLTSITLNRCRDKLRRRKVRRTLSLDWLRGRAGEEDMSVLVARREQQELLWWLVDQLRDEYRLLVILRYQEGLRCSEVARVLGLRTSTVYSRLHTAREQLRARLQEQTEGTRTGVKTQKHSDE